MAFKFDKLTNRVKGEKNVDFYKIRERMPRKDVIEIYPDFVVGKTKDLMVRGKAFYAIWDNDKGLWSTDEYDVARLVDDDLNRYYQENRDRINSRVDIKYMSSSSSNSWKKYKEHVKMLPDNYKQLDTKVIFDNSEISKNDYASHRLGYPIVKGKCPSYNKIISTLYSEEERAKIEWAIGAIISGDSKVIQKFLVFYGDPGTGKSTILDIVQLLFEDYYSIFEAKELTASNNQFSTEILKNNPLIAIQHDGDLSRIEDNSKLNSIVSHEEIIIHEKFKSGYSMRLNSFLLMATNKPVKITDAKAGLIRRLIDVRPTGNKIPEEEYLELRSQIPYELGAIANHCLEVYKDMGKNYYSKYKPVEMMYKTDPFFNFVESYSSEFEREDCTTLKQAYLMYKKYCDESDINNRLQMYKFREELRNYFKEYDDRKLIDGIQMRSYYSGFLKEKLDRKQESFVPIKIKNWIELREQASEFDEYCQDCVSQYANEEETPISKWEKVNTVLSDLDTSILHYVRVPENHIVIDFDLKEDGKKSLRKNLEAAKNFPKTYVETSKSGNGLHLHYIYNGDVSKLSRVYDDNIEVKVFTGNSSLRRKLVKCNNLPIATINSGLPFREEKGGNVVDFELIKSEKLLRTMIKKNLNKEYHNFTKPSIDFIKKLLDDAYNSGMSYDVTDLRNACLVFASQSNNQAEACIKLVNQMHFKSDEPNESSDVEDNKPIIFYDVEIFPNLFLVNWKVEGKPNVVRMINPNPSEIEELCRHKLVGFNCRRYDNHMLYARMMGYTNMQLYNLSQKIVNTPKGETRECFFSEAYNLSYTDIYDYSTKKQSLKKWEIELGIHHQELGLPWDLPVDESMWEKVAEYCDNDVIATEAVWNATQADFLARQILVGICKHAGINACVNDTTNTLTTRIIFGNNRKPELVYTDLATGEQF